MQPETNTRALGEERNTLLKELAAAANFGHRWAKASAGAAVAHVVASGNALAKARDLCDGGEWTRWVRLNFQGSIRTAQRYIRLARHWPAITSDATSVSPESQTAAAAAIRRALFGNERSSRRGLPAPSLEPAQATNAAPSADPLAAGAPLHAPPRVAALAVAGLERLAASLGNIPPPGDAAAAYIAQRILRLAADLRLDVSGKRDEAGPTQLVYFVEAVGAARVKIGVATDPQARLSSLQTACPHRLRLLGAIPGGRELESSLHGRLNDYHLGGEWFFLAKPVTALIARLTGERSDEETG